MASKPDAWFAWTKKVPRTWQEDLDRLMVGENVSRLWLSWMPGVPWEPVQRWVIFEVIPAKTMDQIVTSQQVRGEDDSLDQAQWGTRFGVRGPDPQTIGRWVYDPNIPEAYGRKRWRSESFVSRQQWLVHQQTGGMPHLSWIIQGTAGGHSWNMRQFERAFLLASGANPEDVQALADSWPSPGTLPYAEYDQRVFDQLAERDQLVQWRRSLRFTERSKTTDLAGDLLEAERKTRHNQMMGRVMRFIDHQVGGFVSDLPRTVRSRLPTGELEGDFDQDTAAHKLMEE